MYTYKAEIKKLIFSYIFLTTILLLLILAAILLFAERHVTLMEDEVLYRNMCEKYKGVVDDDYIVFLEKEKEIYDEKLQTLKNKEKEAAKDNSVLSAFNVSEIQNQIGMLEKEIKAFNKVYFRARELHQIMQQASNNIKSANPAVKAKAVRIINSKSPMIFYDTGWIRFFTSSYYELIILLGICVLLGNVFAGEFELKTVFLLFPTVNGRSKLALIKIISGITITTAVSIFFIIIKYIGYNLIYNLNHTDASIISVLPSVYSSLTVGSFLIAESVMQVLGFVVFGAVVMAMSLLLKSAISTYSVGAGLGIISYGIGNIAGKWHILSLWWALLMPQRILGGRHVVISNAAIGGMWIYLLVCIITILISIIFCVKYFGTGEGEGPVTRPARKGQR